MLVLETTNPLLHLSLVVVLNLRRKMFDEYVIGTELISYMILKIDEDEYLIGKDVI